MSCTCNFECAVSQMYKMAGADVTPHVEAHLRAEGVYEAPGDDEVDGTFVGSVVHCQDQEDDEDPSDVAKHFALRSALIVHYAR